MTQLIHHNLKAPPSRDLLPMIQHKPANTVRGGEIRDRTTLDEFQTTPMTQGQFMIQLNKAVIGGEKRSRTSLEFPARGNPTAAKQTMGFRRRILQVSSATLFPADDVLASNVIDLQWFSDNAEAEGRTEQPTEHKLRKLREEGQVPKSQELVGAITLFLPALLLLFLAPSMLRTCAEMLRFFFTRVTEMDPVTDAVVAAAFFRYLVRLTWPILCVAVFAALLSNFVQVGFLFTTKPIIPDFSKIIPRFGQFFGRIFSVEGLFNLLKSIFKMAIIGGVSFTLIRGDLDKLVNLQKAGLWLGLTTVASIAIRMLIISALFLLVLSIADLLFQRWRFRERNKMSKQEMKEEMKMYEGDPQVRNRIRSRFRELLKQNIAAAVPRADVVITNPTHYAVALEYQQDTMPGPMVIAKGADELAARIRKLATDNGVPLVENKPVAQALYRETEVGDYIPEAYYTAVATIFRKVMDINELRRKAKASAQKESA